ncbi:hypothetical protein HDG35_005893 [Paraburkholderia sp. JPY681]|nr:hypothetical protein [Paraburkholderia atlantica]
MFSRDAKHYRPTPRSLTQAFGPHARLHVSRDKTPLRAYAYMAACGAAIGCFWYLVIQLKVS